VLIDSPATSQYSDARIIAAACDATLLVLRSEKTNRNVATMSRDGLISVGAKLLGAVLNDVAGRSPMAGLYGLGERPATAALPGDEERSARIQRMLPQRLGDRREPRPADAAAWTEDDLADAQA